MTVLFACVHNAARSQMAETFFRELSAGGVLAMSAGSEGAGPIDPAGCGIEAYRAARDRIRDKVSDLIERIS